MTKISTSELERRLESARIHRDEEPAFFRSLLDAWVFAHVPFSDDHPRVRLIQFRHPDGFYAIPFFTSEAKARFAGRGVVRTVKLTGRELLAGTLGATLMLNPNDGGCVLYPEEINALLNTGTVAHVEKIHLDADAEFVVSAQVDPPIWLIPNLNKLYLELPFVQMAYLLEVAPSQAPDKRGLLIMLGVAPEYAERAVRATITDIQSLCIRNKVALDIKTFDPAKGLPATLSGRGIVQIHGPQKN